MSAEATRPLADKMTVWTAFKLYELRQQTCAKQHKNAVWHGRKARLGLDSCSQAACKTARKKRAQDMLGLSKAILRHEETTFPLRLGCMWGMPVPN